RLSELAVADAAEADLPRRARRLSRQRALELQPRRSRQPPAGRLPTALRAARRACGRGTRRVAPARARRDALRRSARRPREAVSDLAGARAARAAPARLRVGLVCGARRRR